MSMLTVFHSASSEYQCVAIALFARRICTSFVSPEILSSLPTDLRIDCFRQESRSEANWCVCEVTW